MTDTATGRPELDEDTITFAGKVFQLARLGHAPDLEELLAAGLPANLRNDKGDSLLMLAAYHGHVDAVAAIVRHGGDPALANDRGQVPLAAAAFKGYGSVIADHAGARGRGRRMRPRRQDGPDDGGDVQPHRYRGASAGPW